MSDYNVARRRFLRGVMTAAAAGAALSLDGCGSDGGGTASRTGTASATTGPPVDLALARLAAGIEVVVLAAYESILVAARQWAYGAVPDAVVQFLTAARAQHVDHRDAWNSVLQGAGVAPQTDPDPHYRAVVEAALPTLARAPALVELALVLETALMETCTAAGGLVTDGPDRERWLGIAPVEAQHVAILAFLLGRYPVASSFAPTDQAASPPGP